MPVSQKPQHVAITGASSGLGAELALAYADQVGRLSLIARRSEQLNAVAEQCREKGASVSVAQVDVRQADAVQQWLSAVDHESPVDLVIANAGVFDGHGADGALETADEACRIIEINVLGAIYTVQAAVRAMQPRRTGHIAVVSSLAALLPAADAPTYSASKAALVAYCDATRMQVKDDKISLSVILPGHVQTAQTAVHNGPLAMLVSAPYAAGVIKRGLDRGRTYIAFPRTAHWLVRIASALPWRLKALATRADRFHVSKSNEG